MDISGLSSAYSDYYSTLADSATSSKLSSTLSASAASAATDDELMDVCKQFESYLLEQVFKNMDKTIMKAEEDENSATGSLVDFFKDETLKTIASQSTEQSPLGLAQMLYEQMSRNLGISPDSVSAASLADNAANSGAVPTE